MQNIVITTVVWYPTKTGGIVSVKKEAKDFNTAKKNFLEIQKEVEYKLELQKKTMETETYTEHTQEGGEIKSEEVDKENMCQCGDLDVQHVDNEGQCFVVSCDCKCFEELEIN